MVLIAKRGTLNTGETCLSTRSVLPKNASIADENYSHAHQNGKDEASDILRVPRLLQNENPGIVAQDIQNGGIASVPLNAVQQGVVLAQCLLIERSLRHDEMQSKLAYLFDGCFLN